MDRADDLDLFTRGGLPPALRVLADQFPREGWQAHRNFNDMTAFWMDRHVMFRRLTGLLITDAEAAMDGKLDPQTHLQRLSRLGSHLIGDLHGHHQIEDQHYFPMLVGLDARIAHGFDLLEADHTNIDPALNDFAQAANRLLQGGEAGPVLDHLRGIDRMLDRHLEDEEDLIVPLILSTGFRH